MNTATIKNHPTAGVCRIVRNVRIGSKVKLQLIDSQGRTWHKTREELEFRVDKGAG
jgi:hypothetical protein